MFKYLQVNSPVALLSLETTTKKQNKTKKRSLGRRGEMHRACERRPREMNAAILPKIREHINALFDVFFFSLFLSVDASHLQRSLEWQDLASVPKLICIVSTEVSIAPNVKLKREKKQNKLFYGTLAH